MVDKDVALPPHITRSDAAGRENANVNGELHASGSVLPVAEGSRFVAGQSK